MLATGTNDGSIKIWDIKSQEIPAKFDEHQGKITSLSFSENGQASCFQFEKSFPNKELTSLSFLFSIMHHLATTWPALVKMEL